MLPRRPLMRFEALFRYYKPVLTAVLLLLLSAGLSPAVAQELFAWGDNRYGELGNGTFTTTAPPGVATPASVTGLTGIAAIAGQGFHTLALKSDGTVWVWGWNYYGQL